MSEQLLGNERVIRKLVLENEPLVERMLRRLESFKNTVTGKGEKYSLSEKRRIDKALKLYLKAAEASGKTRLVNRIRAMLEDEEEKSESSVDITSENANKNTRDNSADNTLLRTKNAENPQKEPLTNINRGNMSVSGSEVKYSKKYADFEKPIEKSDVDVLRTIGRKSINDFTADEIELAQKWAHKFYKELGVKSPFFRAWFGDWRAHQCSIFVDVQEMERREGKNPRGSYTNADTGWTINSSSVGYDETNAHSGKDKRSVIAMQNIDKIIKNSILLDTEISEPGRGKKSVYTAFMHKFYAPISIDGKHFIAKMAVDESYMPGQNDTNKKFYHVRAIEIETAPSLGIGKSHTPIMESTASKYSISNLYEFVKSYDKDFSSAPAVSDAVLNEDGTPKVFYHGTNAKFTEFNPDEMAAREGSYFFAENREDADAYGDNVLEVYLSGRNLADYDNQPREFYQLKSKREQVAWLKERGYDGWYADMDSGGWGELSVFSPEQIKSATDNIGTFSKYDKDTRYSYKAPAESKVYKQIAEWEKLKVYEKADAEKMLYTVMTDVMPMSMEESAIISLESRKDAEKLLWAELNKALK